MAQRYIPEIVEGDKRILMVNGEPIPYCLARIPQNGEVRGNLAAGGLGQGVHSQKMTNSLLLKLVLSYVKKVWYL